MAQINLRVRKKTDIVYHTKKNMFNKVKIFSDIRNNYFSYIMLFPVFLYTLLFGYVTMPYMIIAFQEFNYKKGIFASKWVGLKNFEFFLKSSSAWQVTWNTLKLNLLFIMFTTLIALTLSIVLNEIRGKIYKKVIQSTYLFPNFISWIIVSYIVYSFLSTQSGVINVTLKNLGMEPVGWYNNAKYWPVILVIIRVWKDAGMTCVIYLAAITGIDGSLYEAARIDGANRWQQIKFLTLPLLMPTVAILTLLSIGKIFYGDFGMIYALIGDNGLLYSTTDVIDTYVFRALRKIGDPSNAMAVGLYQSTVGFILVFSANWVTRKLFPDGAIY